MAQILLISSNEAEQAKLASSLRRRGHVVRAAGSWRAGDADLAESSAPLDIVLCEITDLKEEEWEPFRKFCARWRQVHSPVLMLCWSRIWRGPRFVLEIERLGARLGARFVYAE
jgi:hypothetical protein